MFKVASRRSRGIWTPYAATSNAGLGLSLSGLPLWLRADAITGIADGGALTTWPESAAGNDAVQNTAGNRPTFRASVKNNLPGVEFDGTNDYMVLTNNLTIGPCTIYIVASLIGPVSAGYKALLSAQKMAVFSTLNSLTSWGAYPSADLDSGQVLGRGFSLLTVVVRAANDVDLLTNAGNLVTRTGGGSFPSRGSTGIGGDATGVQFFKGILCEMLGYSAAHSTAEQAVAHAYFNSKWSLF